MKRLPLFTTVFFLLFAFSCPSFAADLAAGGPVRKLQRGFLNVVLCPMELTAKIVDTQRYETALPTWIAGMAKGTFYGITRGLVGAYEMVTAPIPAPGNYAPVMYPEFAWEYNDMPPKTPKQANLANI